MNKLKPTGPTRIQGDLALLQNPSDLEKAEKWLANWEIFNISNPTIPQAARMGYNAIQFLRGLNAAQGEEVATLTKKVAESRERKKEGGISNLKLQFKFPSDGDIAARIDNFNFQITNIVGGHVNTLIVTNKSSSKIFSPKSQKNFYSTYTESWKVSLPWIPHMDYKV